MITRITRLTHIKRNTCIKGMVTASIIAGAGVASAGDGPLSYTLAAGDRDTFSLELDPAKKLKVQFQSQTRYQINQRNDSSTTLTRIDDDLTLGFVQQRTKVKLAGDLTDSIKGRAIISFKRDTGYASLDTMAIIWKINDGLTLTFGQFKLHALWEENIAWNDQLAAERSATNETFNQDRSQAIEATFLGDNWRARVAVSDGIKSGNTAFNDSDEADIAFTGSVEYRFGEAGFNDYDSFVSFRGASSGLKLGGALHWQTTGETNPSSAMSSDMLLATADAQLVGDGWSAFGAFIFRNKDSGTTDYDDMGAVVQAGVFVTDQTQIFGRWDAVFADSDRGATGNDFHSISVGVNHYLIPESNAAKLTLAATLSLDPTTASIVTTSDGHNLLADSEDGQFGLILQAQFLF